MKKHPGHLNPNNRKKIHHIQTFWGDNYFWFHSVTLPIHYRHP